MKIEKPTTGPSAGHYSPQVQPTGEPSRQAKSKFAGMHCLAIRDDGTVCNAIISIYTVLPCQFCTPCYNRYAHRDLPLPSGSVKRKKRGLLV